MAEANLPGLIVPIEARIDKLEKALERANRAQRRGAREMEQRAERSAQRMGRTYDRAGASMVSSFTRMGRAAGAGLLAGLVGAGLSGAVQQIDALINRVADVGTEAERAGLSVETFQEWSFVADQNRISIDALVDGFKELNLRADEFVTTGSGSAAEAFTRLGFRADDLLSRLENPGDLMLEIIDRLEGFDRSAQIRIADELFGGTGGEQFVQMLDQGVAGIRQMISRAHELGAVMDAEVIERAEETARRFGEIRASIRSAWQAFVVGAVDAGRELTDLRASMDEIFGSAEQARAMLGSDLYDQLNSDRDALDNQATNVGELREAYVGLGDDAIQTAAALENAANTVRAYGYDDAARQLLLAAQSMRTLNSEFTTGSIDADEFTNGMDEAQRSANDAFDTLDEADRVDFSGAISEVGRLGQALVSVIGLATSLRDRIAEAAGTETAPTPIQIFREADAESMRNYEASEETRRRFLEEEAARNELSAEELRLQREITAVRERAAEAGATMTAMEAEAAARAALAAQDARNAPATSETPGGGGSSGDSYQRMADRIREQTRQMDLERAAFVAAAVAGEDFSTAIDLARTRAELLNAALQSGRADSPALRAEIEQLAQSYVNAGAAAAQAENRVSRMVEAQGDLTRIGENAFVGLVTGAMTFQQALRQVLAELARMAASRLFTRFASNIFGGGGGLGNLLGFAFGGYTGEGGIHEPAGIVHRGEYVISKRAVENIGVTSLEMLHRSALKGYSDGGFVGEADGSTIAFGVSRATAQNAVTAPAQNISINAPVTVSGTAGTPEQNKDLADQIAKKLDDQLRSSVVQELRRQMRPGNMLNTG